MGFWQGLNAALDISDKEKARKEELAARQAEIEGNRKFQVDMFMMQLQEERRDKLFELYYKQGQEKQQASAVSGAAMDFIGRFAGMEDDPRVAAIVNNPLAAAKAEAELLDLEKKRAGEGIMIPLRGEVLLDTVTVRVPETGEYKFFEGGIQDIATMDMSDRNAYEQTRALLSQTPPQAYIAIKPDAYFKADPKNLEEGRKLFDLEVLRKANEELAILSKDPSMTGETSELMGLIEDYKNENSAGRIALQDKYGVGVSMELLATDNPYITSLKQDPQLYRYVVPASQITTLITIANAPDATPEEQQEARQILEERYGYTFQ